MIPALALLFTLAQGPDAPTNYQLHCQGCHGPNGGATTRDVPSLVGMGRFLRVPGGRAFLVRVPGVAQSGLSDAELAAVMNWALVQFGGEQADGFEEYSPQEVGRLRAAPLIAVREERARLVRALER